MPELRIEGMTLATPFTKRQIMAATHGLERRGKTHFALTLPDPIMVLPMDNGTIEIAEKFRQQGRKIYLPKDPLDFQLGGTQTDYKRLWDKTRGFLLQALETKGLRSLFIDTGTQFCILQRLAHFGKLKGVGQFSYGVVNEELAMLLRLVKESEVNFIMSHWVKKLYVDPPTPATPPPTPKPVSDGSALRSAPKSESTRELSGKWDGKSYVRQGHNDIGFLCRMSIEHHFNFDTKQFYIKIIDCGADMQLAGVTVGMGGTWPDNQPCDYELEPTVPNLGVIIYPDTTEDDWS